MKASSRVNSGGSACAPRNVATKRGTSASSRCSAIRSSNAASPGLCRRVSGLGFQRGRAVSEKRLQPRANRSGIKCRRVEQRFARLLDRVQHSQRRLFSAQAGGKIRLAIAVKQRDARARRPTPERPRHRQSRVLRSRGRRRRFQFRHAYRPLERARLRRAPRRRERIRGDRNRRRIARRRYRT